MQIGEHIASQNLNPRQTKLLKWARSTQEPNTTYVSASWFLKCKLKYLYAHSASEQVLHPLESINRVTNNFKTPGAMWAFQLIKIY